MSVTEAQEVRPGSSHRSGRLGVKCQAAPCSAGLASADPGGADPVLPPGAWSRVQAALASPGSATVTVVTSEPQALPQRHSSAFPGAAAFWSIPAEWPEANPHRLVLTPWDTHVILFQNEGPDTLITPR